MLEWKLNLVAHGEAREEKWRGKRRMEWVASSLAVYRTTVYPALLPLMRTPRLPAADWTDTPADINGLVRFAGRPNLVSARVPSHSVFTLHTVNSYSQRISQIRQRIPKVLVSGGSWRISPEFQPPPLQRFVLAHDSRGVWELPFSRDSGSVDVKW